MIAVPKFSISMTAFPGTIRGIGELDWTAILPQLNLYEHSIQEWILQMDKEL